MSSGQAPGRREIAIATTFDDAWVPHFATCAASIAASRGRERVRFILLQGPTLSESSVSAMSSYVHELGMELEARTIAQHAIDSLPPTLLFSPLVWYRLLLPELLPDLDRVLALDADTLVLQSLSPLYERDLGNNLLAAVGVTTSEQHARVLGLDPAQPVFNAGVMLMNLDAMRAAELGPRAIALGHERFHELVYAEQDALTILAEGRWDLIHPRWNAMSRLWLTPQHIDPAYSRLDQVSARASPAVVHFEGFQTVKPWFYRSVHPLRFLYRDYRAGTPWPLERLERKSMGGALLRALPVRAQYAISRANARLSNRLRRQRTPGHRRTS